MSVSCLQQLQKYLRLDQKDAIMADYVWVDAEGGIRSRTRVSDINTLQPIVGLFHLLLEDSLHISLEGGGDAFLDRYPIDLVPF